jgi:hypothetical protein
MVYENAQNTNSLRENEEQAMRLFQEFTLQTQGLVFTDAYALFTDQRVNKLDTATFENLNRVFQSKLLAITVQLLKQNGDTDEDGITIDPDALLLEAISKCIQFGKPLTVNLFALFSVAVKNLILDKRSKLLHRGLAQNSVDFYDLEGVSQDAALDTQANISYSPEIVASTIKSRCETYSLQLAVTLLMLNQSADFPSYHQKITNTLQTLLETWLQDQSALESEALQILYVPYNPSKTVTATELDTEDGQAPNTLEPSLVGMQQPLNILRQYFKLLKESNVVISYAGNVGGLKLIAHRATTVIENNEILLRTYLEFAHTGEQSIERAIGALKATRQVNTVEEESTQTQNVPRNLKGLHPAVLAVTKIAGEVASQETAPEVITPDSGLQAALEKARAATRERRSRNAGKPLGPPETTRSKKKYVDGRPLVDQLLEKHQKPLDAAIRTARNASRQRRVQGKKT